MAQFERTTLPSSDWTHRAHLRVAYRYLRQRPFAEALAEVRIRIRSYNAAHHVPTTPTRGYHETITVAFMRLLAAAMKDVPEDLDSEAFLASYPNLTNRNVLSEFYSESRLFSEEARASFVEPDRKPLPEAG